MMKTLFILIALGGIWCGTAAFAANPFESENRVVSNGGAVDCAIFDGWRKASIPVPRAASDSVMVRRLYLDLAGRLPSVEEARAYVDATAPDKKRRLIETLAASGDFADYFTQHWCDLLRVKSEFPINLWPNAVYVYARRIRRAVADNESTRDFNRALLLASGSNFRSPEANFYRAVSRRTPDGVAEAVALTFLGRRFTAMSEREKADLSAFFEGVKYKKSREWKEEIVYYEPSGEDRTLTLPDGTRVLVKAGSDARIAFADWLFDPANPAWSRAVVNRTWAWIFGRGIVEPADDLRSDNPAANPELLRTLADGFAASGGDFRKLCVAMADSAAYAASALPPDGVAYEDAIRLGAAYMVRRVDAEVLDDAICDLTGSQRDYSSVIPEPFSFLPPEQRTVRIYDGSISNSFLLLFGRPARDTGLLSERAAETTAKQRQYLFNSGELYRRLGRINSREDMKKRGDAERIERVYWMFYSRPPQPEEAKLWREELKRAGLRGRRMSDFILKLSWILLNSNEFLFRH